MERSPYVLSRRAGAFWLVTTPDDPDVHELRGGAAIVWDRLDKPMTIDALTEDLVADGARGPDLRAEIDGVIQALQDFGVLGEVRE